MLRLADLLLCHNFNVGEKYEAEDNRLLYLSFLRPRVRKSAREDLTRAKRCVSRGSI